MGLGPKYVIFKEDEYHRWASALSETDQAEMPDMIDGIVLRPQDFFAAPALMEYAGQIRTAVEIVEELFPGKNRPIGLDARLMELKELSDGFADEGYRAYEHHARKIPD